MTTNQAPRITGRIGTQRWDHSRAVRLCKGGHRIAPERGSDRWTIWDNSGTSPEVTDDGVMFLDPKRSILVTLYEGKISISIPILKEGDPSGFGYHTGTEPEGLAVLLDTVPTLPVKIDSGLFWLRDLFARRPVHEALPTQRLSCYTLIRGRYSCIGSAQVVRRTGVIDVDLAAFPVNCSLHLMSDDPDAVMPWKANTRLDVRTMGGDASLGFAVVNDDGEVHVTLTEQPHVGKCQIRPIAEERDADGITPSEYARVNEETRRRDCDGCAGATQQHTCSTK